MKKAAVIILNWNGLKDTLECIKSLSGNKMADLFLVDNASADKERRLLKEALDQKITLIQSKVNLGYCGGNNLAIEYLKENKLEYEYIILLNNDTVAPKGSIDEMINFMDGHKDVGAMSPTITNYFDQSVLDNAGLEYSLWTGVAWALDHGKDKDKSAKTGSYFSGTCFVLRSSILQEVGKLFDDRFFCYFEEIELGLRIKRAGHKLAVVRDTQIFHKESATVKKITGFAEFQLIRNRFLIEKIHASIVQKIFFLAITLALYFPFRILIILKQGKFSDLRYFVRGFYAGLAAFFGGPLIKYEKL